MNLIRAMAASSGVTFGTTAAYAAGSVYVRRIGFADIPIVGIQFVSPVETRALVEVARQAVLRELVSRGVDPVAVKFTPNVARSSRRRRFTDQNASSRTYGKTKMGNEQDFHFEIEREFLPSFSTGEGFGRIGLPERIRDENAS